MTVADRPVALWDGPAADLIGELPSRLVARGGDIALSLAVVVTTLNSQGALGFIASPSIKIAVCAVASLVALNLLVRYRTRSPSPTLMLLVGLLGGLILVTSVVRQLPSERYVLLGQYLAVIACVLVWMAVRPDRLLGVLFTSGAIHLVLAVVIPTEVAWDQGGQRLGGGSHPIQLGFEASMIALVAFTAAVSTRRIGQRLLLLALTVFALYVLVRAFSRQSLIATAVAFVVLAFVVPGAFRKVRAYLAVVFAVLLLLVLGNGGVASLLGADDVSELSSATGRTTIWARVLDYAPNYLLLGYGYAPLSSANGPDRAEVAASYGAPAENALLQIFLLGGIAAAVLWVLILVVGVRLVLKSLGASHTMALTVLPVFALSISVNTGLADGLQYLWFLAVATECGVAGRLWWASRLPPRARTEARGVGPAGARPLRARRTFVETSRSGGGPGAWE